MERRLTVTILGLHVRPTVAKKCTQLCVASTNSQVKRRLPAGILRSLYGTSMVEKKRAQRCVSGTGSQVQRRRPVASGIDVAPTVEKKCAQVQGLLSNSPVQGRRLVQVLDLPVTTTVQKKGTQLGILIFDGEVERRGPLVTSLLGVHVKPTVEEKGAHGDVSLAASDVK
eukprot:Rhum_TRINITY_DN7979_c0_g1::Rhum_TRINITY_DN7979_c0_g1_i1::g.25494::m.25494